MLSIEEYKAVVERLPQDNAVLLHAAAFTAFDKGILIMGPSGIGKTTQMLLWKQLLGDDFEVINDDKPILKYNGNETIIESSLLCGKEGFRSNKSARLFAVCCIDSDEDAPVVCRQSYKDAAVFILRQVYIPEDKAMLDRTIELLNFIFAGIPIYKIRRSNAPESAEAAIDMILKN